jgi:hypothetical protein
VASVEGPRVRSNERAGVCDMEDSVLSEKGAAYSTRSGSPKTSARNTRMASDERASLGP